MRIKILAALAAALALFAVAAPAGATTDWTSNTWAGFVTDSTHSGTDGAAEGVWQETLIPHITSGCYAPNAYNYVWVGQGGTNTATDVDAPGYPFTQNGWGWQQDGSIFAWYVRFDANGNYNGLQIMAASDITATQGDTVTMRLVWNAAHTIEWFTWKNLSTGQYYSVEKDNSGAYWNGLGVDDFVYETPSGWNQNEVQVDQVITYSALTEQILPGWSADSRGVPIRNGGTNSVDNAQTKFTTVNQDSSTRVAANRPSSQQFPDEWTATPQTC